MTSGIFLTFISISVKLSINRNAALLKLNKDFNKIKVTLIDKNDQLVSVKLICQPQRAAYRLMDL